MLIFVHLACKCRIESNGWDEFDSSLATYFYTKYSATSMQNQIAIHVSIMFVQKKNQLFTISLQPLNKLKDAKSGKFQFLFTTT